MRRIPIVASPILAILLVLGVSAAPADAISSPSVTVSPTTPLNDGDQVTVTASDFTGDALLAVVECTNGVVSQDDCDLSTALFSSADPSGNLTTLYTVYRQVFTFNNPTGVDCAPSNCMLVVANIANESEVASTALTFDASQPLPPPLEITATIDHAATFDHAGNVTITGTITCNRSVDVELQVGIGQQVGRFLFNGEGFAAASCDGPTHYSVTAFPSNGIFRGGRAVVKLFFSNVTGHPFINGVETATVQLHGGGK